MKELETINFSIKNRVATIKLNRPKAMNAINQKMRQELLMAIDEVESNDEIRVAVLCAEGRGFSSGGDLLEGFAGYDSVEEKIVSEYIPILNSIQKSSKIFMSSIHGACTGISSGVAMVCDLAIMSQEAYIYVPFSRLNLVPDGGVSYQLVRHLGYKKAMEIYTNAEKILAQDCLTYGLVNKVVASEALKDETTKWAEKLASGAPLAHKLGKQCMQYAMQNDLIDTVSLEAKLQVICSKDPDTIAAIKAIFSQEKLKAAGVA